MIVNQRRYRVVPGGVPEYLQPDAPEGLAILGRPFGYCHTEVGPADR